MKNAVVKILSERSEQGSRCYRGVSKRNPVYTFEVYVQPRGSNKHGISLYGTSRINSVLLCLTTERIVALPYDDQTGQAYELRPIEEQILRDIDEHFSSVQLHVVP